MSESVTRLYLVTPVVEVADHFAPRLRAALAAGDVACLLLRTPPHDDRIRRDVAGALAPVVQSFGTACLVEDDTRVAASADADGVHVSRAGDHVDQVCRSMKPSRIVGVGGIGSRDDAMAAGESGVDYLMFGDETGPEGPQSLEDRLDRVAWWADLFQVPCVAFAHDVTEVESLARAGAEFVALGGAVWDDPRGAEAAVRDAIEALARAATPREVAAGEHA